MRPVTLEDLDEIQRLHGEGHGCNEIARRMGRPAGTISIHAARLGLVFDNSRTMRATSALVADAAHKRARLQVELLEEAERMLNDMRAPTRVFNFGGKDNTYAEETHEEPPNADKRALANGVQALILASSRLAELDKAAANSGQESMIDNLFEELRVVRRLRDEPGAGDCGSA
jgi:hypothetical protein